MLHHECFALSLLEIPFRIKFLVTITLFTITLCLSKASVCYIADLFLSWKIYMDRIFLNECLENVYYCCQVCHMEQRSHCLSLSVSTFLYNIPLCSFPVLNICNSVNFHVTVKLAWLSALTISVVMYNWHKCSLLRA